MNTSTISLKPIHDICGRLVSELPASLKGFEYHREVGNRVEQLPESERELLRNTLNSFLLHMEKIEASDIDLGGHGCVGKIWYRVFGKKSPLQLKWIFRLRKPTSFYIMQSHRVSESSF
jgi:twitching motility protein PilT